jgi:hypothetical protein
LQWHRIAQLKGIGANGWRTAHNPPTPSLLDAMDELGMVCWDENHRNGQFDQVPLLVRRDRNHPSVIFYSFCNEPGCNNADKSAPEEPTASFKAAVEAHFRTENGYPANSITLIANFFQGGIIGVGSGTLGYSSFNIFIGNP